MAVVCMPSKLFSYNVLDIKDELDERLEKCHKELSSVTGSLREAEVYEKLNHKACQSPRDHEDTTLALLFIILTDSSLAHKSYSTLTMITRDSMGAVIHITELLILEKLPRLLEPTKSQLLWLTRELIQTGVGGADRLCFAFLKQMPAGSLAGTDIWLAENLLHLFMDNNDWLCNQSPLVMSTVYTYLSILPTHLNAPELKTLKDLEISLIISLIRNKFSDCVQIGRDLLRLLQNVSCIPEFTQLWNDIINHPATLDPTFTGIAQVFSKRTSRRFVAGRIVTDSEIKMNFLLSKVKFGQHKRYQEWFSRKYLSTSESLSVIPELIRFVCCVIHPPNEVLGSDVLPRWAFIGWLLSLTQANPVLSSNSKLSLFYDWLSYSSETDNIMNIEPAVLLMYHSLHSHPQITSSLLDFLCRLSNSFSSQYNVNVGIVNAFKDIAKKGVLQSLDVLLCSPKLDRELVKLLKATFPDLYQNNDEREDEEEEEEEVQLVIAADDDVTDDIIDSNDCWSSVSKLPTALREKMEEFRANNDSVSLLTEILTLINNENITYIASPLVYCMTEELEQPFNEGSTVYVLLNDNYVKLITLMRECQWKLGYHLIIHLYNSNKINEYSLYCSKGSDINATLLRDIREAAENSTEVFFDMLPCLYKEFNEGLTGSCEMINIIVSHADPYQINKLIMQLSLKRLTIFGKQKIPELMNSTLQWDSFEQFCVWQLLNAEGIETHQIVSFLRSISSPDDHPEAVSGLIIYLKQEPSIPSAVGNLLSLPLATHEEIVCAVLSHWINCKPNKIAKFTDYCFNKVLKLSEPLPTINLMLNHLVNILQHVNAIQDLFKGADCILSHSLDKLFNKYSTLKQNYPSIVSTVKEVLASHKKNEKRRSSTDSEDIIRIKKRRIMTLDELSD